MRICVGLFEDGLPLYLASGAVRTAKAVSFVVQTRVTSLMIENCCHHRDLQIDVSTKRS